MDEYKKLEFYYGKLLRESTAEVRKALYQEAYSKVSEHASERFINNDPENRTAGTSREIVQLLRYFTHKNDKILEIGCGRGYTCLKLAPYVKEIVGIDVSRPSIKEATEVLMRNSISNTKIMEVSAIELNNNFCTESFNVCISIDVVEHLHPEDNIVHIKQVYKLLKPNGKYIAFIPNRLNGPHDITKTEFPEAREALGFHLNETTNKELVELMKIVGFRKIQSIYKFSILNRIIPFKTHHKFSTFIENVFGNTQHSFLRKILEKFLFIRIIAYK